MQNKHEDTKICSMSNISIINQNVWHPFRDNVYIMSSRPTKQQIHPQLIDREIVELLLSYIVISNNLGKYTYFKIRFLRILFHTRYFSYKVSSWTAYFRVIKSCSSMVSNRDVIKSDSTAYHLYTSSISTSQDWLHRSIDYFSLIV